MRTIGKHIGRTIGKTIGKNRLGALLKQILSFITTEQLAVGQINETLASSFEVTEGSDTFSVDNSGNISFLSVPDYDTQRTYNLVVKSNRNRTYKITVYVTILTTATILDGTEIMYNDTYVKAA